MGVLVASTTALSVAANAKSADQVSGTYQFLPFDATLSLIAKASATGLNATLVVNGVAVINDQAIPGTGTAGTISALDNDLGSIDVPAGSRVELTFRNTTGGAITVDSKLDAEEISE